jgi:hypothetical protein
MFDLTSAHCQELMKLIDENSGDVIIYMVPYFLAETCENVTSFCEIHEQGLSLFCSKLSDKDVAL